MRRHLRAAGRTASLLVAVGLAISGCGGDAIQGAARSSPSVEESAPVDPLPGAGSVALECGQPFTLPAGGRLTLAGRFPAAVPAGVRSVAGTVEVTSRAAVQGVGPPGADVFLVHGGLVVTVPAAQDSIGVLWDLGAGESRSLPGEAVLTSCDPAGVGAGTYEVYARVSFAPDGSAAEVSFGGPWPLEVR